MLAINNPGNIRFNAKTTWVGQTGNHNGFVIFDTAVNGFRAMTRVIDSYVYRDGCKTYDDIVGRWAPLSENDTTDYEADVDARIGVEGTDAFSPDELPALLQAITIHENGSCPWGMDVINAGIAAAGN
jgi:hypothetical protein